jgi:ATP-dependent Lhr-like helicase
VATASLELGIDIGHVDLVCQIGSPHRIATLIQRFGRSGHTVSGTPKGRLFPTSRDDLVECVALRDRFDAATSIAIASNGATLDVLTQQIVAETASASTPRTSSSRWCGGPGPSTDLDRGSSTPSSGWPPRVIATRRGRRGALIYRDEVHSGCLGAGERG